MPTRHDLQPLGAHGHEDDTPAPAPTAHTPEPWRVSAVTDGVAQRAYISAGTRPIGEVSERLLGDGSVDALADAQRIVATINACAGIADPYATLSSIAGFLEDVARGCDPDDARDIAADLLALLGEK